MSEGCPMWDEYNRQCMWERMEMIFPSLLDGEGELLRACMEEMA